MSLIIIHCYWKGRLCVFGHHRLTFQARGVLLGSASCLRFGGTREDRTAPELPTPVTSLSLTPAASRFQMVNFGLAFAFISYRRHFWHSSFFRFSSFPSLTISQNLACQHLTRTILFPIHGRYEQDCGYLPLTLIPVTHSPLRYYSR